LDNNSSLPSAISGDAGDDILSGGDDVDVLFGGSGVDALFGRGGNDWLFPDADPDGTEFPEAGELVDGDGQTTIPPGDSAAQLDADIVRDIETLADGGAIKDVLTWLRASFRTVTIPQACGALNAATGGVCGCTLTGSGSGAVFAISPLHNINNAVDVNNDGAESPADALAGINELNTNGAGPIEDPGSGESALKYFYDVTNDFYLSPRDVLMVINVLNGRAWAQATMGGEGETSLPLVAEPAGQDLATPQLLWIDTDDGQPGDTQDLAEGEGSSAAVDDGSTSDSTLAYHAVFRSLGDQPDRHDGPSSDATSAADELSLDDELLELLAEDGLDS
jgi:hypothetical protein